MNTFALHPSPIISAAYHCDQHLNKMIIESAQLLCTSIYLTSQHHHFPPNFLYKPTHLAHPCTKWVCESTANAIWLCELAIALESERHIALSKIEHQSIPLIKHLLAFYHTFPSSSLTPHVFCGPLRVQIRDWDSHKKYQVYYAIKHHQWVLDKGAGMSYKSRPIPSFMLPHLETSS